MSSFDNPAALHREAFALYKQDKHDAAALLWASAREAARTQGDRSWAFKTGFWEANAWVNHGVKKRALGLLLPLLHEVPLDAPAYEQWIANVQCLEIQLSLRPELGFLKRLLADLEALATRIAAPAADLDFQRGQLAFSWGRWEDALQHYARAWQAHDRSGTLKSEFAWYAFHCALRLGRDEDAEAWQGHLSRTKQDWECSRRQLKASKVLLSLAANDTTAIQSCLDEGCGGKQYELRAQLLLRGGAQDPLHDPADASHPARKLAATTRMEDVHNRYDNLMALVDYRLACMRYTAGLPAVDDYYYRRPDAIPARITSSCPEKFQWQVRSFDFSWHLLRRHALRLDTLLQCDWRTREAAARRARRDAIVTASTSLPPSGSSAHKGQ